MSRKLNFVLLSLLLTMSLSGSALAAAGKGMISINVLLNTRINNAVLSDLGRYGKVRDVMFEINALTMQVREYDLDSVRRLPFVVAANPDAERKGAPVDTVEVGDFTDGLSTWDMDVVNVTLEPGFDNRPVTQDGTGVYVAVLDTGLVDSWRQFFPEERIATQYAASFTGGGAAGMNAASQPNKWEHDQNSHGTHVTSTILGYSFRGTPVNGVAPMATVIPVKVLNQNGSGWSSAIARGIMHVAELKQGPLAGHPVVINMSLGGSVLDAVEQAALDYAIAAGVIIVASAGNSGERGMGYPGAYEPVISVAASGWAGEWLAGNWWYAIDDPEPNDVSYYYITDFSSRELDGQDLDVAAPGSWVVGPYKLNSNNQPTYFYLGGTSMASPHVAGIAALMMQKNPALVQSDVEAILEGSALPMPPGCLVVASPSGPEEFCWGPDATGAGIATADAALAVTP